MLYSLIGAVIGLSFLMPLMCLLAFKKGFQAGRGQEPEAPTMPALFRKQKEARRARRYNNILDNIDAYDGTGANQRAVE